MHKHVDRLNKYGKEIHVRRIEMKKHKDELDNSQFDF